MVSHTPTRFGGHRYRDIGYIDIGYIPVLVCHVISQDQLTKGLSNVIGRTSTRLVTILPGLVVIDIVIVGI